MLEMSKAPMDLILERVPETDRAWVTLEVYRFLHSTPDAGRPSDAARAIVNRYEAGTLRKIQGSKPKTEGKMRVEVVNSDTRESEGYFQSYNDAVEFGLTGDSGYTFEVWAVADDAIRTRLTFLGRHTVVEAIAPPGKGQ